MRFSLIAEPLRASSSSRVGAHFCSAGRGGRLIGLFAATSQPASQRASRLAWSLANEDCRRALEADFVRACLCGAGASRARFARAQVGGKPVARLSAGSWLLARAIDEIRAASARCCWPDGWIADECERARERARAKIYPRQSRCC